MSSVARSVSPHTRHVVSGIDLNLSDKDAADIANRVRTPDGQRDIRNWKGGINQSWLRESLPAGADTRDYTPHQIRPYRGRSLTGFTMRPEAWTVASGRAPSSGSDVPSFDRSFTSMPQAGLLDIHRRANQALIRRHNPQDQDPPLPSGRSVDSRQADSSVGSLASGYSLSGQVPPPDVSAGATAARPWVEGSGLSHPATAQASGSGQTVRSEPGRCKHDPGGVIDHETFIGCYETDEELKKKDKEGKKEARDRVYRRKKRSEGKERKVQEFCSHADTRSRINSTNFIGCQQSEDDMKSKDRNTRKKALNRVAQRRAARNKQSSQATGSVSRARREPAATGE